MIEQSMQKWINISLEKKIDSGLICMLYIPRAEHFNYILTKELHKKQFDKLIGTLAMEDIFKPT